MKLIIFGATGRTGSAAVELALGRDHSVTAFVREPSKLTVMHPHLTIVQGDALDAAAVANAVQGHDAAVSTLGAGTMEPTTTLSDSSRNVINALQQHGIKRLSVVLSVGMLYPQVEPRFVNINAEHRRVFDALQQSSLDWIAACPPYIRDYPRTGHYRAVAGTAPDHAEQISRFDLADFTLDQLTSDQYLRQLVGVAN